MTSHHTTSERDTLTIEELAIRLGINRSTAYERARRDELPVPVIRIGRRYLVSRQAYEAVMSAQHSGASGSGQLRGADTDRQQL